MTEPDKDFRYTIGDSEFEAFQLTPHNRWQDKDWPPWVTKQRLPEEPNTIYTNAENPSLVTLTLPVGEIEIPELGWVAKYPDGTLGVIDPFEMEKAVKVVPNVPKVSAPPADGMPDESHLMDIYPQHVKEGENYKRPAVELSPAAKLAAAAELPGSIVVTNNDVTEMRNEMVSAIKILQESEADGENLLTSGAVKALEYLIAAVSKRTRWCNCSPGNCEGEDDIGCRVNSPLVKHGD